MTDEFRVACNLEKCTLVTLKEIYEDIFKTKVDINTNHSVVFENISLEISNKTGIILKGSVSVENHAAESAMISMDKTGITINGKLVGFHISESVVIINPALDLQSGNSSDFRYQVK
jgi:hypothetical protein